MALTIFGPEVRVLGGQKELMTS